MKNTFLILTVLISVSIFYSCSKNSGTMSPQSNFASLSFTANDSSIHFPISTASIQEVLTLQTTVIIGKFADTSSHQGSISIRVIGDTTGRYSRDSLLVTYTNSRGVVFNNVADSANYVQIDKYPKNANGIVSGSFNIIVMQGKDTIKLSKGVFTALYQE
ncbi:MAG: hypothetical protein JST58_12935 [Bacteroidetes bacterium]|nr:hypothetical protein [Bacteroidota bacterium]